MQKLDVFNENIPIAVVGINHRTAKVEIREEATFTESQQRNIINRLNKDFNTRGVIILSTCNRTEIYLCGRKAIKYITDICTMLDKIINKTIFSVKTHVYIYIGRDAIQHFFRVITGLDSQILGEPQITGQVKDAYEKSRQLNSTDTLINKMYNFGMQAEKEVRNKTYLTEGAVSVSFAGVELARKIFGNLQDKTVLLIGAGETVELAATHFFNRKVAQILVANRTFKKSRALASKFEGEAVPMDNLPVAFNLAHIVLSATSSDTHIIGKQTMEEIAAEREYKPLFIIDLAMPRDIDPTVSAIDGIFLYNLDALKGVVEKNIERRKKEIPRAEKIVQKHVVQYLNWYSTLPVVKTITELSRFFEDIREREFERLRNRFPEKIREDVEYLSKSLMKKFLHHHIVTLRQSNKDPQRQQQHIDLVGEIYPINGSGPKHEKDD